MLPSCFEVTHPILIRLTPKSDPNRGDCLGNHHPVRLSLGLSLRLQPEGGDGRARAWAHRGPAERVRAPSPLSLPAEATSLTVWFYNVEKALGAGDEPVSLPPQNSRPQVRELTGKAQGSDSKGHMEINENQLELSWAEATEENSAASFFFLPNQMLMMG